VSVTGFVTAPVFLRHDTGPGHPERPGRLTSILERLDASGLGQELACDEARKAEIRWIQRVHAPAYVTRVRNAIRGGARILDEGDTAVSKASWDAALTAVGAALGAGDRVMSGEWRNAFCAVRPPGHHAEEGRAMGFCLFDNVAVLARYLQEHHGLARVAILDWDVHHGNGTQHLFEHDGTVFYASLHQYPHYPGTGAASERGIGAGEGATLNCPMPAGTGDKEWLHALENEVLPALEAYDPDALLISAGFDAHAADPLSATRVTAEGFRIMSRRMVEFAEQHCQGRLVSLLEGGYDLEALADSVQVHLEELKSAG
jgi:acetoin utilization deacetylase AcuC-like enzyme